MRRIGIIMKKVFGLILFFIDLMLIIGGLTCLIIGLILYRTGQAHQLPLINTLFALGFVGVGSILATLLFVLVVLLVFGD